MRVVILGLSITSSWGNGHATNFRALMRSLHEHDHQALFLERDVPWYAARRDLPEPPWGQTRLYDSLEELRDLHRAAVAEADLVIVGSYVPEGIAVGAWVVSTARGLPAFYDIDTPVTLARLEAGECDYLSRELVRDYGLYLSFTGGPTLRRIEDEFGSPCARAFHCLVDPDAYPPLELDHRWDLGYLGTYSPDRQPALERLLLEPARRDPSLRCVVAGPQYPGEIDWPQNVERIEHLAPAEHPSFYAAQRFTLNITRAEMLAAGFSPSVRLFEAAACTTPAISDRWNGVEDFFIPGREIAVADGAEDVLRALALSERDRRRLAQAARARVLAEHTADHRLAELEAHVDALMVGR